MKRIGSLAIACFAILAHGQTTKVVSVTFPVEGDREVWVGSLSQPDKLGHVETVQGTGVKLSVDPGDTDAAVYVHDKRTGNVAVQPVGQIVKTGLWKVTSKDETRVYSLKFHLSSQSRPVKNALLRAKTKQEERTVLVDAADKGGAEVRNILAGQVEITVDYKVGREAKTTAPQIFEAKLGAGPAKVKTIDIQSDVPTIEDPKDIPDTNSNSESQTHEKVAPDVPQAPNPLVSLLNVLIGLGVVAAVGFGIYSWAKKNPKQLDDGLKKLGLGEQDPAPLDTPLVPQQPQPLKQIDLGAQAAYVPDVPTVVNSSMAIPNPRLVQSDGKVHLLSDGANAVGREAGLSVSCVGESSVSRHHATLTVSGSEITVSDEGSTNGTYVNGQKVSGPVNLRQGDVVQFGAAQFTVEV